MDKNESLADSIRRKVSENRSEVQKELDTTEVSASQMQRRQAVAVADFGMRANPLLPMCIALSIAVVILSVLLLLSHLGH